MCVLIAGIAPSKLFLKTSPQDIDEVLNVNLKGAMLMSRMALPLMVKQRCGAIVNIGSVVGSQGRAGVAAYSASKSGLIGNLQELLLVPLVRCVR